MEKEFDYLIAVLEKLESFELLGKNLEAGWIHFKITQENNVTELSNAITEIKDSHAFSLLVLANQENSNDLSYQLIIESDDFSGAINALTGKLLSKINEKISKEKHKNKDLGIPDLALVTIRQMANELRSRPNLTFALVWIENNERDNIAIEGSGNPTQLVGLLTRGSHMAIEWADKNIKFYRPSDEE